MEFLKMGGHGLHVWGSVLVLPALVLLEVTLLLIRKREIYGHLGWRGRSASLLASESSVLSTARSDSGLAAGQTGARTLVRHHERRSQHRERRSDQHDRRSQHHERRVNPSERRPHGQERRSPHHERRATGHERRSEHNERRFPHNERRSRAEMPEIRIPVPIVSNEPARPRYLD